MAKTHARWLEKDGKVSLYSGSDVDAALANGAKEPKGIRPNGEPWNPEVFDGEGLPQSDSVVAVADGIKAVQAKEAERKDKEAQARLASDDDDDKPKKGKK